MDFLIVLVHIVNRDASTGDMNNETLTGKESLSPN